jgi:hypothetical protein
LKIITKIKGHFIPGIPLNWIKGSLLLHGNSNAIKLALYVWYCQGLHRTRKDLVISSKKAEELFGVNRRSFSRALDDLIKLKMISAERGIGRSPRVNIIYDDLEEV